MSPRMNVAVAVLTIGLAVAALAGIPIFIENRGVGDIFALVGLVVAVLGVLLVLFALRWRKGDSRPSAEVSKLSTVDLYGHRYSLREQRNLLQVRIDKQLQRYARATMSIGQGPAKRLEREVLLLRERAAEIDAAIVRATVELHERGLLAEAYDN
jgi:hypothetical protein